jgi:hypothetical protein
MKATAILIFLTLFLSQGALAEKSQKHKGPDIDALVVQLKLDASKVEKFKAILEEQRETMKAQRKGNHEPKKEKSSEERKQMRKQREAQHEAMDEKLLTVLNHEQLYNFKKYMKQFRQKNGSKKDKNGSKKDRKKNDRDDRPEKTR